MRRATTRAARGQSGVEPDEDTRPRARRTGYTSHAGAALGPGVQYLRAGVPSAQPVRDGSAAPQPGGHSRQFRTGPGSRRRDPGGGPQTRAHRPRCRARYRSRDRNLRARSPPSPPPWLVGGRTRGAPPRPSFRPPAGGRARARCSRRPASRQRTRACSHPTGRRARGQRRGVRRHLMLVRAPRQRAGAGDHLERGRRETAGVPQGDPRSAPAGMWGAATGGQRLAFA